MAPLSAGEESPLRRAERVFFVADVPAFVREIWRMVRPGGRLAVTTWGRGWLEPASTVFSDTVREVRPELHKPFSPRDEITSPEALTALLAEGGVGDAVVVPAAGRQNLDHPEDFWEIVLGSGLRGTVDVLDDAQRTVVQAGVVDALRASQVTDVGIDAVIATATKPPP